jgi:hypothetical protein
MDIVFKQTEVVNTLNSIIISTEFDASGMTFQPIYERDEKRITSEICCYFNFRNIKYKSKLLYEYFLYSEIKYNLETKEKCDLVFSKKRETELCKSDDEIWMECRQYREDNDGLEINKVIDDINKLKSLKKPLKAFCLIVNCKKNELPKDSNFTNIIESLNKEITATNYMEKKFKISNNSFISEQKHSYCYLLFWFF